VLSTGSMYFFCKTAFVFWVSLSPSIVCLPVIRGEANRFGGPDSLDLIYCFECHP